MSITATPTVSRLHYQEHVKLLNAFAWAGERLGLDLGSLDPDSIVRAARRQTGLHDLGDESFLAPMRRIAQGVARQEGTTALARVIMRQSWLLAVKSRLQREAWLADHPQIHHQRIERPIFVLGFPRTGTTVLQNLLSLDPRRRGLNFWELTLPVPVHEDRDVDREQRRRATSWMLKAAYQLAPEMARVHFIDVDTVEECWPLFALTFSVLNWDLQSGIDGWGEYLMHDHDMFAPYRDYRTSLKMLVERNPCEQLVLKCPEHLFFIDALLAAFPDACIVQTHRDPYAVIGSYCSLMSMQWRNLYGRIDRERIGSHMQKRLHDGVSRAMAARDAAADESRFFDVRFHDLVKDQKAVVDQIAEHFDLDLAPDHAEAVATYLGNERADARGKHKYDPGLFGLDRDEVHEQYADYIERFGIQT
ncbi:MAG: sulfotransferase [Myxococcales bacterium]|nr:sulfotransferase [Myxococcales bacterium]